MISWARVATGFGERLWLWVPLAVIAGLLWPPVAHLEGFAVLLLALIVGGVAVTLDVAGFRGAVRPVFPALAAHVLLVLVAWSVATSLGLASAYAAGFVLLGASTPDLTAPLLARIAHGRVHVTVVSLLGAGLSSLAVVPLAVVLLIDASLQVPLDQVLRVLVLGVAVPFVVGVAIHRSAPRTFTRLAPFTVAVSVVATVLVTALVAAVNRDLLVTRLQEVPVVGVLVGVVVLFLVGMAAGRVSERAVAVAPGSLVFIAGTREYALAAALVLATPLPREAALVPLLFGALQMVVAPLMARRMAGAPRDAPTG